MRAPISLEDRTLLKEEPFASHFSARLTGPKHEAPQSLLDKVSDLVEKAPGGVEAVEEWVNLAFDRTDWETPRQYGLRRPPGQKTKPTRLSIKTLKCFVKFYWYLFSNLDAMQLLRTQKLSGYTLKLDHVLIKREPYDEPMSPLTELSDDDDTPLFPTSIESSADAGIKLESPEQGLETSDITSTPPMVPKSLTPFIYQLFEPPFVVPLSRPDSTPETVPHPIALNSPPADSEFNPIMSTPLRPKLPQQPAPPERKRGRRPRPVLQLPVADDTSAFLPPAGSLTTPSTDDMAMSHTLESGPEAVTLLTPSVAPLTTDLPVRPLRQWTPDRHDPLVRRLEGPRPLPAAIEIKHDPSEEGSDFLRLLDPADVPENWLNLPMNETRYDRDEVQGLTLITEPPRQYAFKPPLPRLPPIWAQSRQEVCESFEWFRSYQGGVYQGDGKVKGYFLSAFAAKRDLFACGGKIIISHGGGKAESSRTQNGQVTNRTADDQRAHDISVRALIENYRLNQPLVLLIDDKYGPFPFNLGSHDVYMAVLGFYKIIHVWAEYQPSTTNARGRVVRFKFAFQWCEDQGEPWWATEDLNVGEVPRPVQTPVMGPTVMETSPLKPDNLYFPCSICSENSPRVFCQAWACLNPTCPSFWITPSGYSLPEELDYNPEFLSVIDLRPLPLAYRGALLPKPPILAPKDGITTTYRYSRGWHCRKCGRLSCRSAWEQYQCPNCKDTHAIIGNVRPAKHLMSIRVPISDKFVDSFIDPWSRIGRLDTKIFNHFGVVGATGRYQTFVLPDEKGKIHLIQTNRLANVEADRIFEAYQQQASDGTLLFRRWPLRSHKLRGPLLTNYFSQNSGETYHYVGGTDNTVPFDRAPGAVIQARDLIQKRIREALGVPYEFNEVLSAGYMEQQKMAFHSDSENGLGPVVAGLSMGSPALMHFRLLSKYAPRNEQRANAMTVVLRHGDVLVMEGAGVQDFYEFPATSESPPPPDGFNQITLDLAGDVGVRSWTM